jgi:hypothetical protein
MASHYTRYKMDQNNEEDIRLLREKEPQIKALNLRIKELKSYVVERFFHVMKGFGFKPNSMTTGALSKHFYSDEAYCEENGLVHSPYFRFYIAFSYTLYNDQLHMYFELQGPYTKYGDLLKAKIEETYGEAGLKALSLERSDGGSAGGPYYHVACMDGHPLNSAGNLEQGLRKCLEASYFNGTDHFVKRCTMWMNELTKQG